MKKKDWFAIAYVSLWVIVWGTIGSIIDLPLLNSKVYLVGSFGQFSTFLLTALLCIFIGIWLFPKLLANTTLVNALGLDSDNS